MIEDRCHGFFWSIGGFMPMGFPDSESTCPSGITAQGSNDSIRIVGSYTDLSGNSHGFLLEKGVFGTYHSIDVPGANSTSARSINAAGQIVGTYTDAAGTHGFKLVPNPI